MASLSSLFSRRYLFSRNSLSVINIISWVSVFAVGVPVAAMVILLSVFNGFDSLVKKMYGDFDPDLMVVPAAGKVFAASDAVCNALDCDDVAAASFLLEDDVMLEYRGRQIPAVLRGVDESYADVVPVEKTVIYGDYELRFGDMEQALVGQGVAYSLGVRPALFDRLKVYAVRRGDFSPLLPLDGFNVRGIFPEGIFALDVETDSRYVFSTIEFARDLLEYEGMASAAAVRVADGERAETVARQLSERLGDGFRVLTRQEQKASVYRILKIEKLGIFFISLLVLVIASFSVIGTLVMLILEKKDDIGTLFTMGADARFVRRIFVGEGALIGWIGTIGGLVVGLALALVQQHFGIIKIGAASFLVDAYPVVVEWTDVAAVAVAATAVVWIIGQLTVSVMIPRSSIRKWK